MTGSWKGRMRIRVSVLKIQTSCFEYRNPSLPSPGYSPEAEKNPLWCPVSKDTLFLHEVMRGSCLTAGWKRKARNLMAFHRIFSVPASLLLSRCLYFQFLRILQGISPTNPADLSPTHVSSFSSLVSYLPFLLLLFLSSQIMAQDFDCLPFSSKTFLFIDIVTQGWAFERRKG